MECNMEYKILIENQLISKELDNVCRFLDFNQMLIDNGYTVNEYYVFDLTNNLVSKVFIKNIKEPKFISIDKSLRTPKFHNEESLRITNELFNLGSVPQQFTKFNNQLMNNQLVYDDLYKSVQPKQYADYITELTKELINNGLRNKLFLNWLIKDYKAGNCLVEDLFVKGIPCIIDFNNDNIKNILSEKGYSLKLTDYKVNELYGIIENIKATEIIDDTDLLNKRMICKSGDWVCVIPQTHEESVSLSRYGGTITSWCTAVEGEDRYFNEYTGIKKYGEIKFPLLIFLNLNDPTEKYQANVNKSDSGFADLQFMDINDNNILGAEYMDKKLIALLQNEYIKSILYCKDLINLKIYPMDMSEFEKEMEVLDISGKLSYDFRNITLGNVNVLNVGDDEEGYTRYYEGTTYFPEDSITIQQLNINFKKINNYRKQNVFFPEQIIFNPDYNTYISLTLPNSQKYFFKPKFVLTSGDTFNIEITGYDENYTNFKIPELIIKNKLSQANIYIYGEGVDSKSLRKLFLTLKKANAKIKFSYVFYDNKTTTIFDAFKDSDLITFESFKIDGNNTKEITIPKGFKY